MIVYYLILGLFFIFYAVVLFTKLGRFFKLGLFLEDRHYLKK